MARDVEIDLGDFPLERGGVLDRDVARGRIYGREDGPLIVVMGGISASRFVADSDPNANKTGRPGWWSPLVRPGGPIDLNTVCVLGYDFAPNAEIIDYPNSITTADQARRLHALLSHIDRKADAIIGSSYGGMTGLAFAQNHPDDLHHLCVIGASYKPCSMGVAWRGIQRRIVRLGQDAGMPERGMKLARELAMTTYRTPEEFAGRFELEELSQNPSLFDICSYLGSRGDAFAQLMDARRFLLMSESIDLHRVTPEAITTPTLLMTAISDQLAPLPDMRVLRDRLSGPAELFTFTSLFGHDAFLKEYDSMSPRLAEFIQEVSHGR